MIYIVLGMHKSGTSLIAETLHKSGINMVELPDEFQNYHDGLKHERQSTSKINKEILGADDMYKMKNTKDIPLPPSIEEKMEKVISDCAQQDEDWGFKDPRTCLTFRYWEKILPEHKIIGIYRNPAQVVSHVVAGYRRPDKKLTNGIKSIQVWKNYNQILLDIIQLKNPSQALLFNYEDFMSSKLAIEKLSEFTGRTIVDVRKKDHFNFKKHHHPLLSLDLFSKEKATDLFSRLERQKENI